MPEGLDAESLIGQLSPTLGEEMARKLVSATLVEMGLASDAVLTLEQRDDLLRRMGQQNGLPGLAATVVGHRLRLTRTPREAAPEKAQPRTTSSSNIPKIPVRERPSEPDVPITLIVSHMAGTLGMEKAQDLVARTAARMGLPVTGAVPWAESERIIDAIAKEPGIVGLAAKVSKQRIRMGMAPLAPR